MKRAFVRLMLVGALLAGLGVVQAAPTTLVDSGANWKYATLSTDLWADWGAAGYGSFDWTNAQWDNGQAAFGNPYALPYNTYWAADTDLALQTSYILNGAIDGDLTLNVASDNGFIVFVNGNQIAKENAEGYTSYWEYTFAISPSVFQPGVNMIEVLTEDHGVATFFDMKLSGNIVAVPAPGAILLAGMGTSLVGWLRRRRSL